MIAILHVVFGGKGQVVVGVLSLVAAAVAWYYGATLHSEQLLKFIYHVSMFFGCVACYSIIATGLGYRATERVESVVTENAEIQHADNVDVG